MVKMTKLSKNELHLNYLVSEPQLLVNKSEILSEF